MKMFILLILKLFYKLLCNIYTYIIVGKVINKNLNFS